MLYQLRDSYKTKYRIICVYSQYLAEILNPKCGNMYEKFYY